MDLCFENQLRVLCSCICFWTTCCVFVLLFAYVEASQQSGGERKLQFLPKCIYLKFEGATWQIDDLEMGVYPLMPSNNPWTVCEATKIKAKRRGFRIVPDFSATASVNSWDNISAVIIMLG